MGSRKMRRINEALGVPDNILKLGEQLYNKVLDIINNEKDFDNIMKRVYTVRGGIIGDVNFKSINISFNIDIESNPGYFDDNEIFSYRGMSYKPNDYKIESSKDGKEYFQKHEQNDISIDITLDFKLDETFVEGFKKYLPSKLYEFISSDKSEFVQSLTHELMHGYDFYKANVKNIKSRVDYNSARESIFMVGSIRPLNELFFMMYYFDSIENSIRASELAAEIKESGIKQYEFLKKFKETTVYKNIQRVKNISFEGIMKSLSTDSYMRIFFNTLKANGISGDKLLRMSDAAIVDAFMNWFYDIIKKNKSSSMKDYLLGDEQKLSDKQQKYFDDYIRSLNKHRDYKDFFKSEIGILKKNADNVLRKISGVYAYIPLMNSERVDLDDQVRMLAKMVNKGDRGSIELAAQIADGMGIDFNKYVIGRYFKSSLAANKLSLDVSGLIQYFEKRRNGI
jgi:hypothetical protein